MPWSERRGVRTHYSAAGSGPTMLMLHPNPFDGRFWLYQAAHFQRAYRVLCPDLRAYGLTTKVETPYGPDDLLDDLLGVLDREDAERAIVIGASVGARLALLLALQHPGRVAGLILVGGNSGTSPRKDTRIAGFRRDRHGYLRDYLGELVSPAFRNSELGGYLLSLFAETSEDLSVAALEAFFAATNSFECTSRLPTIEAPTLVVNGEFDHSLEVGRRTASLIPAAAHRVVAGAGHACCIEAPAEFNSLTDAFLESRALAALRASAADAPGGTRRHGLGA